MVLEVVEEVMVEGGLRRGFLFGFCVGRLVLGRVVFFKVCLV